jgi:hypothetical protein
MSYTSNIELNIHQSKDAPSDVLTMGNFAAKNRFPVVVTDPEYLSRVLLERAKYQGKYKVIVTVDADNGKRYGMEKFRPLPRSIFDADGYDILLSPDRSTSESLNEMKIISKFIIDINPLKEIRWTLGMTYRQYSSLSGIMNNIKIVPCQFVRTDMNLESIKSNIETAQEHIKFIREYCATPIKVCGNVNLAMIKKLGTDGIRYDVSARQARNIINEINNENNPVREIKQGPDAGVITVNNVPTVVVAGDVGTRSGR